MERDDGDVTGGASAGRPMNRFLRRALLGAAAGLLASPALGVTLHAWIPAVVLGVTVGAIYGMCAVPSRRAYIDHMMTAATWGVPLWCLVSVLLRPLLHGDEPSWTAAGLREQFPALVGWILYGAGLGLLLQGLGDAVTARVGPEHRPAVTVPPVDCRIVILGGGFAGVTTAAELEQLFGADPRVAITLVSDHNALLFTPMLAEVAASSLEATHISSPLRTTLKRTAVVRGRVIGFDLDRRQVSVALAAKDEAEVDPAVLPYDHLVVALGAVSNYLGLRNVEAEAFDFKSLGDAIRIRNHVIDRFERADGETDPERRREMLTFVVAGGGFAGAELAGGLNDLARGMLACYPNLVADDLRIVLVHSGARILPELSEPLGAYALERMAERGVSFKLNTRVVDARPGAVVLSDSEIRCQTLVWTAGTAPNPLLKLLPVDRDRRGAIVVDRHLAVPGHSGVWALGDAAAVTDAVTGKPCPPTAQFAIREASLLARNLHAQVTGGTMKPFHFDSLGALCVIGHHTACAEIRGHRFSGLFAWLLWRAIYLGKLPSLERKVRVLVDWTIELFFPRDIVQTIDLASRKGR